MPIYLPIAELSIDLFLLLGLGALVGILSGIFGVGGGFLLTPLLIFMGIPAPVAVASQANLVVASSMSGMVSQLKRGNVDMRMGLVLLAGGLVGSFIGVLLFRYLRSVGQIDFTVAALYVVFLSVIGGLMLVEGVNALRQRTKPARKPRRTWLHKLPLSMVFPRSRIAISIIPPLVIGFFIGLLAAIMGVGGGFIMIPAMIYLLGMPTAVVIGTSMFQILILAAATSVMQAVTNQSVDIVLGFILMLGGAIGAQIGLSIGSKLRGEQLRILLALLVLGVGVQMFLTMLEPPAHPYSFKFLVAP
ncbi:MAG TPA: permease [Alphaproteobacteria bacterium]|nr:permease [Paracoccaceae bacterium]RCL78752.1 MAG: sulfite exporter TauE/SafE family protein [SAR116 cluster bacterium]HBQ22443.1 permease [Alphaproteobacteria bacterium]HCJ61471.1 permease [Alphaproteobacteria bacterium]HCY48113.1 permease [Alphaproteobacteria bacterium]